MSFFLSAVGNQIKEARIQAGLSQDGLAKLSGIDRAQLSRIEAGEIPGVTLATLNKIVDALELKFILVKNDVIEKDLKIHPFVKWAGGKTQLLETIKSHLPNTFNRYYEPFVGGGALLFYLQPESFSINDNNQELIAAFKCFQDDTLFVELKEKLREHERLHNEEYYYQIRALDQDSTFGSMSAVDRAARMIYLNKSCFNGLYRVNAKGYFNVPSGKKETVNTFDEENFDNLRKFFKQRKTSITSVDFEQAVNNAKAGDFVYFDPPYDILEDKNSFTSYGKDAFGKEEQKRLAKVYKELSDRGVFVMLSNHNTKFIQDLYKDFHINVVEARRNINSKGDARGKVEEVLITNYE